MQTESDVLSTVRLVKVGLIDGSIPSSSGGDTCTVARCCWGTLPSLVLGGTPLTVHIFNRYILYFLTRPFARDDSNVHFTNPSLSFFFFFLPGDGQV